MTTCRECFGLGCPMCEIPANPCPDCTGRGEDCDTCGGSGFIETDEPEPDWETIRQERNEANR